MENSENQCDNKVTIKDMEEVETIQLQENISCLPNLEGKEHSSEIEFEKEITLNEESIEKTIEDGIDEAKGIELQDTSEIIDDSFIIEELDIPLDEDNEAYKFMSVCSTAAEAIKKTIAEVLNTRNESTTIAAHDLSSDLEASLKEKIADFESVVTNCCPQVDDDVKVNKASSEKGCCTEVTDINKQNTTENELNSDVAAGRGSSLDKDATSQKQSVEESKEKTSTIPAVVTEQEATKSFVAADDEKYVKKQLKSYANKKKGEKITDQVLKSLANYATSDEKLKFLCKKHVDTLEELRLVEPRLKQCERQVITLNREKEQLQAEHNRMILAKSRLESLCRELQRQNKAVKEESLLRIREEEEKRKEVGNKFQATLNDISALMQENSKKNINLREENGELAKKLKALVDHYEMWEKHMDKVVQQKGLEAELAKAKHAKTNLLLKQETEKFLREKQFLLQSMNDLQMKCTTLTTNELQLRTELGDYTSKYEEFQTVLSKSSQVFESFKTDMEATSKKIKKLEKETNVYKQKWQSCNVALLNMITDKQKSDKELMNSQQRVLTLEKLCRALQGERNDLQNQVNILSSTDCVEALKMEGSSPIQAEAAQ